MSVIQAGSLADLVAGTLSHLGKLEIENIAQDRQEYFAEGWMKKERITLSSGKSINFNLYNEVSGNARHVGLFDEDIVNIPDLVKRGDVPWRHAQAEWAVEYRSDVLMNSGDSEIVDLIKLRREDCALSLLQEIEGKAWGDVPATTDEVLPYGIRYWIVTNGTTGFNGGLPGSHTTVGGVNLDNSPNFKNYTVNYTTVNKPDLVKKMRTMKRKVGFKSAVNLNEHTKAKMREKYRIYTVESVVADLEDVGEAQNKNLGRDIASINGEELRFRGHPIMWVPELDQVTTNPLFFINHGTFRVHMLKGNTFRETRNTAPHQHNIEQYFEEASYNYVCHNRRLNGVASTS